MKHLLTRLSALPLWQIDAAGAALVCLLAGVCYLVGLKPLNEARAERNAMEAELSTERTTAQDRARLLAAQDAAFERVAADLAASAVTIHAVEHINIHVSALEKAAGVAGLRVDEIKPAPPTPLARFTMVPIRLSGLGDFESITAFFRALRAEFRDTGLTAFKVHIQDGQDLRFEMDLVWYAAPRQPPAKK